jgi:hypothetical protein
MQIRVLNAIRTPTSALHIPLANPKRAGELILGLATVRLNPLNRATTPRSSNSALLEDRMKNCTTMPLLLGTLLISVSSPGHSQAQSDDALRGANVVITDMAVQSNNELPTLMKDDVKVKQGKTMYTVT